MFNILFPNKTKIFDSLLEQAQIIEKSAETFKELVYNWEKVDEDAKKLEKLEDEADKLVHAVTDEIEVAFILPLDKEDIKQLTDLLDDIEDNIEQTANRLSIYNIATSNDSLKNFSDLILDAVQKIGTAIKLIKSNKLTSKEFLTCYRSLHEIENKGDRLHRTVLKELLGDGRDKLGGRDPIAILKWVEIFQTLEDTLDACEDVAIVFDRLRIKYR